MRSCFTYKQVCIPLILLALFLLSFGRKPKPKPSMELLEDKLISLYQQFWYPDVSAYEHHHILVPQFKKELEAALAHPESIHYPFQKLAKKIKIRVSEDKKLRTFSWDDNTSPNWRHICSIAQYLDDYNHVRTQWLSMGDEYITGEFTDIWIYGIHELANGRNKYYMTIGEGCHGNGQHHLAVQIFDIDGKQLKRCHNCFENAGDYLVVQAILLDHFNLIYDEDKQELSYSTFQRDESSGFYIKTGERTKLRFTGTIFKKARY